MTELVCLPPGPALLDALSRIVDENTSSAAPPRGQYYLIYCVSPTVILRNRAYVIYAHSPDEETEAQRGKSPPKVTLGISCGVRIRSQVCRYNSQHVEPFLCVTHTQASVAHVSPVK